MTQFARNFALALLPIALLISGCTPKSETSKMSIAMPDWSAITSAVQADRASGKVTGKSNGKSGEKSSVETVTAQANAMEISVITRVMINITGPGLPTQVLIWDIKDYNYNAGDPVPVPPDSFTFSVDRGASRMFQALAIVQQVDLSGSGDTDGKAMTFFYGDVTKNLALSEESLSISLANQGTANGDEGSISGRYVDANGMGPSGALNMYYVPPTGPEMIVDTGTIFSGFFQLFIPSTSRFSYRTASGTTIFNQINVDSFQGNLGDSLTKIHVPAGFRDNGTGTRSEQGVRTRLAGYVGPGASGRKVCYDSRPVHLSNLYVAAVASSTDKIDWNPASADDTFARVLSGGVSTSDGTCPAGSGDVGAGYFEVQTQLLPNGDSAIGNRGPFSMVNASNQSFMTGSFGGTSLRLEWKYLRPTLGDSVAGVGVFTRSYAANETIPNRWSDSAPCSKLVSDFGFTEVTRVAAGTVTAPVETYTITGIPAAQYASGRYLTLVCPYAPSGAYYNFALMHQGSSSPQQMPATQIIVKRKLSELGNLAVNPSSVSSMTCTPMTVRLADASGNVAYRAGATGNPLLLMTLLNAAGDSNLYLDAYCSSGSKGLTLNALGEQTFYVRVDTGVTNFTITAADTTPGGTTVPGSTFFGSAVSGGVASKLVVASATTINAFECTPITFVRGSVVSGEFVPQTGVYGGITHTNDMTNYPGLNFYAYGDCGTATTSSYFSNASQSAITVFVKYAGVLPQVQISPDSSGVGLVTVLQTLTVTQPGPATQIRFGVASLMNAESCVPFRLYAYDATGRPAPMPVATNIAFSYSPAPPAQSGIYSDFYCMTPISAQALAAGDTQSNQMYMRWTSPGAVTFGESAFNGVVPVTPAIVNFAPAMVANIVARIPEVNWSFGGGYLGTGPQQILGASLFNVILEARSLMGNLVTNFMQTDIFASGLFLRDNFNEIPNCLSSANFINGVAQLTCNISDDGQSPGYRVQFVTGGSPTSYPFNSTQDQFFITRAGEQTDTFALNPGFKYASGTCVPVMIQRRAGASFATMVSAATNVPLTALSGIAGFYSNGGCTSTISAATIPAMQSSTLIYMLATGGPAPAMTAGSATLLNPYLMSAPTAFQSAPISASIYQVTIFNAMKQGACEPVMFTRADSSGAPIAATAPLTLTLGSTGMNAQWFLNGACSGGPISNAILNNGESAKIVYMRAMQQTGSGSVSVIDNDAPALSGSMPNIQVLF